MKETQETIREIRETMERKIKIVLPKFESMALSQTCISTQGDLVEKANPEIQEARALFKDYVLLVEKENALGGEVAEDNKVTELRARFKVAK